jgi:hypothetical protein
MMRVWNNGFIPATVLGALGAIAVSVALVQPSQWWWLAVVLAIAALVGVTVVVWFLATPKLGVSD